MEDKLMNTQILMIILIAASKIEIIGRNILKSQKSTNTNKFLQNFGDYHDLQSNVPSLPQIRDFCTFSRAATKLALSVC